MALWTPPISDPNKMQLGQICQEQQQLQNGWRDCSEENFQAALRRLFVGNGVPEEEADRLIEGASNRWANNL